MTSFSSSSWSFKHESIQYYFIDCISVFKILHKFNHLIFEKFQLNINNYSTLPSLSFAIFRAHYLRENTIAELTNEIFQDIKQGYTEGAVDMFIPQNKRNEEVYCYDVNSLYPFVMK